MWTKKLLVNMAFDDLSLAGYIFDLTPEEIQASILRLDSMMANWELYGIRIGYQMTENPESADPDQPSGIPDWANEAVYKGLAIRQAASFGKATPPSLAVAAKQAYDSLLSICAHADLAQMQFKGNLPLGGGWKQRNGWGGPFVRPPTDVLTTGPDGPLDFNGSEVPV